MSDPTEVFKIDAKAALAGGRAAGEYADSIGKTDFANFTDGEWMLFCMKLVGGAFLAAMVEVDRIHGRTPF